MKRNDSQWRCVQTADDLMLENISDCMHETMIIRILIMIIIFANMIISIAAEGRFDNCGSTNDNGVDIDGDKDENSTDNK